MLNLPKDSPEYQRAAAAALPIFAGVAPDPTNGATAFYSPRSQAALGREKPAFDDGTGTPIGGQLYFQGDYRRTHPQGKPLGIQYRLFAPPPPRKGLFDTDTFPLIQQPLRQPQEAWPSDGSAGSRPPLR
jgi:hypothetical protein